jgi:hypothetical protein
VGVTRIVLGFAPLNGLHRERVPPDKGTAFFRPEIRQPVPGEHTFDPDDHVGALRRDNPPERCGRRGQMLMDQLRAAVSEDTDIPRLGV